MAPPPICREVEPWWWGWYQKVPPAWSQGMVYSSEARRRAGKDKKNIDRVKRLS